jgi:hypothetical protein
MSGWSLGQTGFVPFYRRRWGESRDDEHDDWGPAVYYFWVQDGVVEQQVVRYEAGALLTYDRYHLEDQYGQLTVEPLDPDEWATFEIDIATYQSETDGQPFNRKG